MTDTTEFIKAVRAEHREGCNNIGAEDFYECRACFAEWPCNVELLCRAVERVLNEVGKEHYPDDCGIDEDTVCDFCRIRSHIASAIGGANE